MGKRQRLRGTSPWGRGEWLYLAACNSKHLDPAWWFDDDPAGVAKALRVCRRCPVRPACLDHALDNREQGLDYAMQFARDLDTTLANRFVGMYVNERTLDYGPDGKQSIQKFLDMGFERGLIPHRSKVDFIG